MNKQKRILGLDVIAFDANYNKLDPFETTTIVLFEELKKNSEFKNQASGHPHHTMLNQSTPGSSHSTSALATMVNADTSFSASDTSLLHFYHKSAAISSYLPNGSGGQGVGSSSGPSAMGSSSTSGGSSSAIRSSSTYCLQVSLFNLVPSPNCPPFSDENCDLCVNLFLYKVTKNFMGGFNKICRKKNLDFRKTES